MMNEKLPKGECSTSCKNPGVPQHKRFGRDSLWLERD